MEVTIHSRTGNNYEKVAYLNLNYEIHHLVINICEWILKQVPSTDGQVGLHGW
jgi:hypothetical protein